MAGLERSGRVGSAREELQALRFAHRMAAFAPLSMPSPLQYHQYASAVGTAGYVVVLIISAFALVWPSDSAM